MEKDSCHVIAFDTLHTTNHIQMLKIILSRVPESLRPKCAIYIKYLELQHTISYYNEMRPPVNICSQEKETEAPLSDLLKELSPYCTASEKKQLDTIESMLQAMELLKQMEQYKDLFDSSSSADSPFDMDTLLKQFLTPEQQSYFDFFQRKENDNNV